ncbi:MAG: FAD-dependent oxidoreductase [Armatimonadetes bacterium]|jgi:hypothetical protein|nr:FAD-dependent oxidoreductase [Armatimonadota bacterium]
MTKRFITDPARQIELLDDHDVVVAGGGPAGICAGLAAARRGLKTLIIEQSGCLGGIATAGLHSKIAQFRGSQGQGDIIGGIPAEIVDRAVRDYEADYFPAGHDGLFVEIERFKYLLDRMAEEASLEVLFYSQVADVVKENGQPVGVILNNKSGRFAALASVLIDCSGDGDVAYRAGCRMMHGRDSDGKMQPVTLMYTVGGVDTDAVKQYMREDHKLRNFCRIAAEQGYMRPWQSELMGFWFNSHRPDQINANFTHMLVDGSSAFDLTEAAVEGRRQVQEAVEAMRALIPGFQNSYLIVTAPHIGVRETRRIYGKYIITEEDIRNQTIFSDSIGLGSAFIDIHNTEGPGMDKKSGFSLPPGGYYSIPYRTLVPESMDNLLVAGRCHSATHEAAGSTRWMTQCMVMGQAAGTAAAIAIDSKSSPSQLDPKAIQGQLKSDGVVLE